MSAARQRSRAERAAHYALCIAPSDFADVICLLRDSGFEAKRLRTVAHRPGKGGSLVLIEARRGAGSGLKIMPPLHICGDDGRESAEIKRIYHRED